MTSDECSTSPWVAVPESRERETLSLLLRNRGIRVIEVPLVTILDAPNPQPVIDWLNRFIADPPALLILLTGEGLRRLLVLADKVGSRQQFVEKLGQIPTLCRGPKPEKVLQELGLKPAYRAALATSAGVLSVAQTLDLAGKKVALQLYGEEPNPLLVDGLAKLGAKIDVVAPYVYASKQDEERVAGFIKSLAAGEVGVLAFTSQSQLHRLVDVAKQRELQAELAKGMNQTVLAAVGPVVKAQLEQAGFRVSIMPERLYFMKPLVTEIVRFLGIYQEHGL
jgi:uroporphyrinogen-III synthase